MAPWSGSLTTMAPSFTLTCLLLLRSCIESVGLFLMSFDPEPRVDGSSAGAAGAAVADAAPGGGCAATLPSPSLPSRSAAAAAPAGGGCAGGAVAVAAEDATLPLLLSRRARWESLLAWIASPRAVAGSTGTAFTFAISSPTELAVLVSLEVVAHRS